jgi:ABC-type phosphate transport system substrate-binding protein
MLVVVLAALLAFGACGGGDDTAATSPSTAADSGAGDGGGDTAEVDLSTFEGTGPADVVVYTDERLRTVMLKLARAFNEEQPDTSINVFAGSPSEIEAQIAASKPSVYVDRSSRVKTFNDANGTSATQALIDPLVLVVAPGNPKGLAPGSLAGAKVGLCAENTVCGDLGRAALETAGASVEPAQQGDPAALVEAVLSGDLDAALVLRTQASATADDLDADDLDMTPVDAESARVKYEVAVTSEDGSVVAFDQWVQRSPAAEALLQEAGLRDPAAEPAATP